MFKERDVCSTKIFHAHRFVCSYCTCYFANSWCVHHAGNVHVNLFCSSSVFIWSLQLGGLGVLLYLILCYKTTESLPAHRSYLNDELSIPSAPTYNHLSYLDS